MIQFPKYLILYTGELNKHGLLEGPLNLSENAIDITAFADKEYFRG